MHPTVKASILLLPLAAMAACTQLSDSDRALLTAASQNAEQAKTVAQQALDAAHAAQSSADKSAAAASQAAQAAEQAAAAARDETEKVDRMFRHSLRKAAPPQ